MKSKTETASQTLLSIYSIILLSENSLHEYNWQLMLTTSYCILAWLWYWDSHHGTQGDWRCVGCIYPPNEYARLSSILIGNRWKPYLIDRMKWHATWAGGNTSIKSWVGYQQRLVSKISLTSFYLLNNLYNYMKNIKFATVSILDYAEWLWYDIKWILGIRKRCASISCNRTVKKWWRFCSKTCWLDHRDE